MLPNLSFFKSCFESELKSLLDVFLALPEESRQYRPHSINRSAEELVSHLLSHVIDMKIIAKGTVCDETMDTKFDSFADAAMQLNCLWAEVVDALAVANASDWETEKVQLLIHGAPFVALPRFQMMWFFMFDVIHHRGQLSTYIRPMGGSKVPAIYGYSADTASI